MYLTNKFVLTAIIALGVTTSASAQQIGVGGSVGGVSAGVGASVGHGSGGSVGAGIGTDGSGIGAGVGVGIGHGSTATKPGSVIATKTNIIGGSAAKAKIAKLQALVGATVMSADRKMIGMVENAVPAPNDKIDVTIRLNVALGAKKPTVTLRMNMPDDNPKRLRLSYSANRLIKTISG